MNNLFQRPKNKTTTWYTVKYGTLIIILTLLIITNHTPQNEEILGFNEPKLTDFNITKIPRPHNHKFIHTHVCNRINDYKGPDKCQFLRRHCENDFENGNFNYMEIYYCTFKGVEFIYYILIVLFLVFLFYLMGNTADVNFCPSLTQASIYLKLEEDVAGVTLLALGNGAPDIASIISGVDADSSGVALGEPLGAGIFITSVVLGTVSILGNVNVPILPFYRDSIVFLIGVVSVLLFSVLGNGIHFWQSFLILGLYFLYVFTVVIGNFIGKRFKKKEEEQNDEIVEDDKIDENNDEKQPLVLNKSSSSKSKHEKEGESELKDVNEDPNVNKQEGVIKRLFNIFLEAIEWKEKSIFKKIFFIIEGPTLLVRNLTIPKADPAEWSKPFAVLCPIFMPAFAMIAIEDIDFTYALFGVIPLVLVLTALGVLVSVIVFFTTNSQSPPKYHFIMVFFSFVFSILWLFLLAEEVVDIIQALGIILGISDAILAITVLSWGVSLGDLVANSAMARQGFTTTSVSACFAGPTLNLLIGLGLGVLFNAIRGGSFFFESSMNKTLIVSFIFCIFSIISSLVVIPLSRFRSTKQFGVFLYLYYLVFMIVGLLIELDVIWVDK